MKKKTTEKKLPERYISEELKQALWRHARIPPLFWQAIVDPESASLTGYVENIRTNIKNGTGLLLIGPHGVGKTWSACAIAKAALNYTARVLYINAPSLVQAYIDEPLFDDDVTMVEALANRRLLAIDDLGQEYRGSGSGHSETRILNLIRYRIQHKLCTVITTNMRVEQLEQTYGKGFASLLQEGLATIQMKGPDRRRDPGARTALLERSGIKGH